MKSRSDIWLCALEELGEHCSVSTARDAQTFARRLSREGDEFLTLTLPSFGKELERALASESIPTGSFAGWSRRRGKVVLTPHDASAQKRATRGLPEFLGGFLDLVFTDELSVGVSNLQMEVDQLDLAPRIRFPAGEEGVERMADAIAAVRQLTLMFSKEKVQCTVPRQDAALADYVKTDQMLCDPLNDSRASILFEGKRLDRVRKVISIVFGDALSATDLAIYDEKLTPGHGPGATADGLKGNQKWTLPTWHDRLEYQFPYGVYGIPNYGYTWRYAEVKHLAPLDEPPVKVKLVPKTQRSPRLIAVEPTCMQYVQQAITRTLVPLLEVPLLNRQVNLSSWFVGFTDQTPNNNMACIGSEDGSLATLDLSEASDRIANWLVEDLFADFPHFLEGIQACRSTRAMLPSGQVIDLQKFASMGSALTFPIEAIVFCAVVLERVLRAQDKPISRRSIKALRDMVRVYGDDILVPNDTAETVADGLETLGFKVNRGKSFWTGKFRESCGKEFWNGRDVSIVKFRTALPASQRDAPEIISTVSTRNQLYMAGMWKTAAMLDGDLDRLLKGFYPIVTASSPVLGRVDNSIPYEIHGWDSSTQSPFVRGYVDHSKTPYNGIDEEHALMKCLIESIGEPNVDDEHLKRSGRPRVVSIKLVKARPF